MVAHTSVARNRYGNVVRPRDSKRLTDLSHGYVNTESDDY
jgi:hypothetical protein